MKKLLISALCLSLSFTLIGCGGGTTTTTKTTKETKTEKDGKDEKKTETKTET